MVETLEKQRYMMSSIFDSTGKFTINESLADGKADPRVDGENIIGSVEGVFFVPNGFSRNNRFYPCELWNKQLSDEEINRRLSNSIMFGCIGHSQGPVTEQDLSDGKVSHIMDKLWIDESTGMGMGKAYILNTPAGRNLRTYLKAGSNLKVSSRGEGSFAEGVEKDGHPVVEAASYNLITFDFVIEPGFTETNPQLQESYIEEVLIEKQNIDEQAGKEESMDEKMLEDLKAEKEQAIKSLKESKVKSSKRISSLRKKIETLTEEKQKGEKLASKRVSAARTKVSRLSEELETYRKLGSAETLEKASMISKAAIQELKNYKTLGTVQQVQEVLKQLVTVSEELQAYRKLGSVDSIKSLLAMSERFVRLQKKQAVVNEARGISEKSGKPIEEVAKQIETEGVEATKKCLDENVKSTEKVDVILETSKEQKTEVPSLLESLFAESNSRMFIQEEDDDEEKEENKEEEKEPVEEPTEDDETEKEETGEEEEVEDADETPEDEKPETEEERLDDVEEQIDSLQSQIDALTASFDKLQGEEDPDEEMDFDFEIE